ncbi:MAG: hypothetical protein L0H84_04415 [Pseudonocardia sp.]|nr:hypothetical protein [Pseudonocardia sp.]
MAAHSDDRAAVYTTGPPEDLSTSSELELRADVPAGVAARKDETAARLRAQAVRTRALVQARSNRSRDLVAEKAPALDKAVREQPLAAAGLAAVLAFLIVGRSIRRRRRRATVD